VLGQDYPGLEYFVADGGSKDDTVVILQSYGEQFQWVSEPDRGQSHAINKGWGRSQGEIVAWLNSDDRLAPGALQAVGRYFAEHPEIDGLYGDCNYINGRGQRLSAYPAEPFDYPKLVASTINYLPQPATFIRRKVLETTGGVDEALHYVMDFDLWLRSGLRHSFAYLPQRLADLRVYGAAKSIAGLDRMGNELIQIYQAYFQRQDLSFEIRALQSEALGMIYQRAADCHFWAGKLVSARRLAFQAWRANPRRFHKLWLYLLLGSAGRRMAERRSSNPYLLQPRADEKIK
jgi:glycosyltransferase involved in cell wall biosynthesis